MIHSASQPKPAPAAAAPYLIVDNTTQDAAPTVQNDPAPQTAPGQSDWILDVLLDVAKYANNANLNEVEACLRLAHADVATYLRNTAS